MSNNATSSGRRNFARKSTRNGPPGRRGTRQDSSDKENVENSSVATPMADYVTRIREVTQEITAKEFCKRKNEYEKLVNEKEAAEIFLRTSIKEESVDTSKVLKLEGDIQMWNKKRNTLGQEISEVDEKIQDLKNIKEDLNDAKRMFDKFVDATSEKLRSLNHVCNQRKEAIEKSQQNISKINNQMEEVLKTKKSTDPFTDFLAKAIAQKSRELECPVCLAVCQPPILRCPLDHLVCKMCRPMLSVCGECRQQYKGEDRHRYAERSYEDLQVLLRTREEYARNL